eukprot:13852-Pelagococcus_subviridis.AAC.2
MAGDLSPIVFRAVAPFIRVLDVIVSSVPHRLWLLVDARASAPPSLGAFGVLHRVVDVLRIRVRRGVLIQTTCHTGLPAHDYPVELRVVVDASADESSSFEPVLHPRVFRRRRPRAAAPERRRRELREHHPHRLVREERRVFVRARPHPLDERVAKRALPRFAQRRRARGAPRAAERRSGGRSGRRRRQRPLALLFQDDRLRSAHSHPVADFVRELPQDVQPPEHVERVPVVVHALHRGRVVVPLQQDGDEEVAQEADAEDDESEEVHRRGLAVTARLAVRPQRRVRRFRRAGPVHVVEGAGPVAGDDDVQKRDRVRPVLKVRVRRQTERVRAVVVLRNRREHEKEDVGHPRNRGEKRVHERPKPGAGFEHLDEAEETRGAKNGDHVAVRFRSLRDELHDPKHGHDEVNLVPRGLPIHRPRHRRDIHDGLEHVQHGEADPEAVHDLLLRRARVVAHEAELQRVSEEDDDDHPLPVLPLAHAQAEPTEVIERLRVDVPPLVARALGGELQRLEPLPLGLGVRVPHSAAAFFALQLARDLREVIHERRHE